MALLIVAGGLVRRRHRSWQAAVLMVATVAVLHIVKGLDVEEATASLVLLAGLLVWRRDFDVEGDPETPRTFRRHLAIALAGLLVLGFLLIEGQSLLEGDLLPPVQATVELLHNVVGLGPERLEGRGSTAVSRAILLYSIVAAGWLLFLWLKPRRQYVRQHARDRADARRIVLETGTDTLDYFALRRDKDYFFGAERDAFIAYRVSGGVALISGDPVGRRRRAPRCCARSSSSGTGTAGGSPRSASAPTSCRPTRRPACARSTSATRRSSTRARSRSRAARSARSGSRCTGCRRRATR